MTVFAPDAHGFTRTTVRLGEWAQAQWLASHGYFVVRGAALGYRGQAVVLVGGSRCGASVLALVLSRRGWGLISDGLVSIDSGGVVHSLSPSVTVDSEVVSGLPLEVHRESLNSGRDQVVVTTNSHPDAPLGALVSMCHQRVSRHSLSSKSPSMMQRSLHLRRAEFPRCCSVIQRLCRNYLTCHRDVWLGQSSRRSRKHVHHLSSQQDSWLLSRR